MMVIDGDEFEKRKVKPSGKLGRNQRLIVAWLKERENEAFSQTEIREGVGIKYDGAVNSALHSLKRKRYVSCKVVGGILYWSWNNEEELLEELSEDSEDS